MELHRGQMWSLVTETKKGVQNRTEANPMTVDPQYNVGFSWARQYGFRVAKTFADDKFTLAFAVEGPQTTFGGRGVTNGIFFVNAPGSGGGLFNATDATGYTVISRRISSLRPQPIPDGATMKYSG